MASRTKKAMVVCTKWLIFIPDYVLQFLWMFIVRWLKSVRCQLFGKQSCSVVVWHWFH